MHRLINEDISYPICKCRNTFLAKVDNLLYELSLLSQIGDESGTDSNHCCCYTKPYKENTMDERSERIRFYSTAILEVIPKPFLRQ